MLSTDVTQVKLTRKTTVQVVESSVNVNNISLIQDYVYRARTIVLSQVEPTYEMTPGFSLSQ